ncbi:MAG TPA: hypothetical protein V6C90_13765, partial [Coleofasciculaceae cyanobacterium]
MKLTKKSKEDFCDSVKSRSRFTTGASKIKPRLQMSAGECLLFGLMLLSHCLRDASKRSFNQSCFLEVLLRGNQQRKDTDDLRESLVRV